ncbi:MAG: chemotaxis protein CheX [Cocleimonas sp.]
MEQKDIIVFIDSATSFFAKMSKTEATVGIPFLMTSPDAVKNDYTGIIGITGKKRGLVYFSAPERLLRNLLHSIGENTSTNEAMSDLVGEVANTLAGNAREYFGSEFIISVPHVIDITGKVKVPATARCYVIPIEWEGQEANIIISLE